MNHSPNNTPTDQLPGSHAPDNVQQGDTLAGIDPPIINPASINPASINPSSITPGGIDRRAIGAAPRTAHSPTNVRDRGQATTEYALVLLGAALVGVLVIGWATSGGGAAAINRLFSAVIDSVIGNV